MSKEPGIFELDKIKSLHDEMNRVDEEIPIWLPLAGPILAVIGFIVFLITMISVPMAGPGAALGGLGMFLFLSFIGAILQLYLVYKWLDVINNHFDRVRRLFKELSRYLEARGYKDLGRRVADDISDTEYKFGGEKSPVLWAILVFLIPILIWYVLHVVNKSLSKVGYGEYSILQRIDTLVKDLGLDVRPPDYKKFRDIPDRNTILYIVLSIITLGLFQIYWAYAVTKDINEHFRVHRLEEANLINCIENIPVSSEGGS